MKRQLLVLTAAAISLASVIAAQPAWTQRALYNCNEPMTGLPGTKVGITNEFTPQDTCRLLEEYGVTWNYGNAPYDAAMLDGIRLGQDGDYDSSIINFRRAYRTAKTADGKTVAKRGERAATMAKNFYKSNAPRFYNAPWLLFDALIGNVP